MKVAVVGLGYVGLVQAVGFARLGHTVLGIDIDEQKIISLQAGKIPFFEPGLDRMIQECVHRLSCTHQVERLAEFGADLVLICAPTPARADGSCETEFVEHAVREVAHVVQKKTLVVLKSTVPPGIRTRLAHLESKDGIELASVPEFLREGHALRDFFYPDRIVLGVQSAWAEVILREAHQGISAPYFVMTVESAQLTKYASNAMLATRLSFINEIANIADLVGADISDIASAMGADTRIGPAFLRAGAGFGGSCFPKDVLALAYIAKQEGYETRIIRPIIEINKTQPAIFVQKIKEYLGEIRSMRFSVWGLAFAGNTDDVRESPALRVIQLLLQEGAEIRAFDPKAMRKTSNILGDSIQYASTKEDACIWHNARPTALLVLTEWKDFIEADFASITPLLEVPVVFDGKNCLMRERVEGAGLAYCGIGLCKKNLHPLGN